MSEQENKTSYLDKIKATGKTPSQVIEELGIKLLDEDKLHEAWELCKAFWIAELQNIAKKGDTMKSPKLLAIKDMITICNNEIDKLNSMLHIRKISGNQIRG